MTHSSRVDEVRAAAAGVRSAMTGTGSLTNSVQALDAAVGRMARLEQDGRAASPTDLEALRNEICALEHLVRNGEEFLRVWARMLGLDTGYTAAGLPGQIEATLTAPRVDLEG